MLIAISNLITKFRIIVKHHFTLNFVIQIYFLVPLVNRVSQKTQRKVSLTKNKGRKNVVDRKGKKKKEREIPLIFQLLLPT